MEITPDRHRRLGHGGGDQPLGRQEDAHASSVAIHAALDADVNWIDTAAVYGLGHAEEVVGKAIAGRAPSLRVYQVQLGGMTRARSGTA